ncbi:MAG: pyridoxal-phosphate dependent enzyme [candidate division KSB1 bacterium]|nr:pyridoxal-phosphate dependent enzyme [candidate division KSB1 bacterium]MDZ7276370.1 pyridoxal-phosphate dependent enzyme [candidate division KSB1 bacterium]MDZ7287678.1 pyridoxal-phosphate dependent enzyme [candidate division KSB1 bacterium]MDZ7299982.1 pyridoxal-phosphate dependent enzyme [candidate division KSB1 bacterium]MDZ7307349.1 pyridoxal-phosphate dependent enzyme [candidate division KSB1 bacterium]
MIDLQIHEPTLQKAIQRARERHLIIPTFEQLMHPEKIPAAITEQLRQVGLWEVNPLNLFRITWKNEPRESGGLFGGVNFLEIPPRLSGVAARLLALVGKWFPTGAHKVGATFGCLVPRLVTGQFDPTSQKAVWPSTGNFCRGGAYNSALLGCDSIAILPEGMSRERFDWLKAIAGEVIATPGSESNVKEIYDKCWELRCTRRDIMIFNQFEEFGNYLWHFHVTGRAVEEVFATVHQPRQRLAGFVSATGSAGTLACGDYVKQKFPQAKIVAAEALQCPTLLANGYGSHRIEGIGDKHVPWIHNVRNTDVVVAVDDEACLRLIRLFNEPAGRDYLAAEGVPEAFLQQLPLIGISGIANLIAAIKFARAFELNERDVIFTVFTDSMALYTSRLAEMRNAEGPYTREHALRDFHRHLQGLSTDYLLELTHAERKRIHQLKYYTWIEQQGRRLEELQAQWYDYPDYWLAIQNQISEIDRHIAAFNARVAGRQAS